MFPQPLRPRLSETIPLPSLRANAKQSSAVYKTLDCRAAVAARNDAAKKLNCYASPRVSISADDIASAGDFPPHSTNWNTG